MTEFKDCGKAIVTVCGDARKMIAEKQYEWMIKKKYKRPIPEIIQEILDEVAKEYFKNKKSNP